MVTFGALDRQFVKPGAEFAFAAVIYKGYWTIAILDIELEYPAGEVVKTGVCANRPRKICRAIVDTGTYLIYGPRRYACCSSGVVQGVF